MIVLFALIPLVGLSCFAWLIARRAAPLLRAKPDPRFDHVGERIVRVLKLWLGQSRQPRYLFRGTLHMIVFFGFLILAARSIEMVILGVVPGFSFGLGPVYDVVKELAAGAVLAAVVILAARRIALSVASGAPHPAPAAPPSPRERGEGQVSGAPHPAPAAPPSPRERGEGQARSARVRGATHTIEPFLILGLIGTLMVSELVFSYTNSLVAYTVHDVTFFVFLCFLPMGKHFHVITSLFNVFFMRLRNGNVKPVAYGVTDLDSLQSFGVKTFDDFTWKHVLDFYSCADCGRCSDRCPANRVKRPLSPRMISIKARDYAFAGATGPLVGGIFSEDEIWSCTTCGACEAECPIGIEYIDKIVDLRRGMVDGGLVPQSLQKPMSALEKRGNPWGKLEKKRAEWAGGGVKLAEKGETAETLYFVDSITSYDDRMQKIAQATARVLAKSEVDFVVLGKDEKDSGHDVRRFGEEMLFQTLKEQNTEAIKASEAKRIVVSDPHAMNALRNDYDGMPPVQHISEVIAEAKLSFSAADATKTYTYHDPCYLGRHNGTYDAPRQAIDAIPGLRRVEMSGNCRDRSFCCGGGGLALFYEPQEEQRMGVVRVKQAADAGANVIVTACPYCLTNIEDAIKVAGLDGAMEAIDLVELVDRHLQ